MAPRCATTLPVVHSASAVTGRQLNFDSSESPNSSFSAYDDFDEVSTPSSLQGGGGGGGGYGTSKSMGTLRDFDLAEDILEHFAQGHSGVAAGRSGVHRHHPNAAVSPGTGRYNNSPTLGLQYAYQQDRLPQSPDRQQRSPDSVGSSSNHSYQGGGVVMRGGGVGSRGGKPGAGAVHTYGDDGIGPNPYTPSRVPRPHARTGSDEQYDIQEILGIWNDSPSNPFEEQGGTLV